ncbi:hypothetical protein MNBD_UNCLBAC01-435, partial [hydrothermal vent metagenome]
MLSSTELLFSAKTNESTTEKEFTLDLWDHLTLPYFMGLPLNDFSNIPRGFGHVLNKNESSTRVDFLLSDQIYEDPQVLLSGIQWKLMVEHRKGFSLPNGWKGDWGIIGALSLFQKEPNWADYLIKTFEKMIGGTSKRFEPDGVPEHGFRITGKDGNVLWEVKHNDWILENPFFFGRIGGSFSDKTQWALSGALSPHLWGKKLPGSSVSMGAEFYYQMSSKSIFYINSGLTWVFDKKNIGELLEETTIFGGALGVNYTLNESYLQIAYSFNTNPYQLEGSSFGESTEQISISWVVPIGKKDSSGMLTIYIPPGQEAINTKEASTNNDLPAPDTVVGFTYVQSSANSPLVSKEKQELYGGINLDPTHADFQVQQNNQKTPLLFSEKSFEYMNNIQGFSPIILKILPINNLPLLLGFQMDSSNELSPLTENNELPDK